MIEFISKLRKKVYRCECDVLTLSLVNTDKDEDGELNVVDHNAVKALDDGYLWSPMARLSCDRYKG